MTKQPIPCQQNNDISLDELNERIARAEKIVEDLEASPAPDAVTLQNARNVAARLRLEHHPDHWFIDPQSSIYTEDGRVRRRAREACWADCPMKARLLCLDLGLQEGHTLNYGIYGGRTEKERQSIVAEIKERARR
jgi:hypothetical protein